jgi:predicted transcriptional regulator
MQRLFLFGDLIVPRSSALLAMYRIVNEHQQYWLYGLGVPAFEYLWDAD